MTRIVLRGSLAFALAWMFAACLNTDPLPFVEPAPEDAGSEASSEDPACRQCMAADGGQCAATYAQCQLDTACWTLIDCVLRASCLVFPKFDDRYACARPCLAEAGIATANHPAIPTLLAINTCSNETCASACVRN